MPVEIYSTDTDAGTITVIGKDESTDEIYQKIAQIKVGNAPRGAVKFTKSGKGYVSNCGGNTISEIDVRDHKETAKITVGIAPRGIGIIPGDHYALVSNSGEDTVSIVDLIHCKEISKISVGKDPRHMAITNDGRYAYVAIWASHYISKINTAPLKGDKDISSVKEVKQIKIKDGSHPYSLALDSENKHAYVANTQSQFLTIINLENDEVEADVDLGNKGARAVVFSLDGKFAFVTLEDTSEIVVIETASRTVVRRIDVGPGPRGLAIDPSEMTLYSSCFARTTAKILGEFTFSPNSISVVDLSPDIMSEVIYSPQSKLEGKGSTEIPVGAGPCSVSILDTSKLNVI